MHEAAQYPFSPYFLKQFGNISSILFNNIPASEKENMLSALNLFDIVVKYIVKVARHPADDSMIIIVVALEQFGI